MKQELPIAVGLLAAGSLLWFSGGLSPPAASPPSNPQALTTSPLMDSGGQQTTAAVETDRQKLSLPDSKPTNPLLADQKNNNRGEASPGIKDQLRSFPLPPHNSSEQQKKLADSATFLHAATDPRAVEFLNSSSRQTANSVPFGTSLKLKCAMFDQLVAANGKYFQMGQGSHLSRLELTFQDTPPASTSFQLCDGRFVYRLQTIAGQQMFEFVDLKRIAEKTGSSGAFSPSEWVATGGLSSLLQQFRQSFNFGAPKTTASNAGSQTVLRGCWNETALRHALGNEAHLVIPTDGKLRSRNRIRWDKIPPQLPHGIEIVFTNDKLLGQFPQQIRYVRFVANKEATGLHSQTLMSIDFSPPTPINSLAENMFVIRSSDIESIDTTDDYLIQVGSILAQRQAERNELEKQRLQ